MGGTTAKAVIVESGRPSMTSEYEFRDGLSTSSRFVKAGGYMLKVPAIDIAAGFHTLVTHYHFPGWQRPSTAVELVLSRRLWDQLPDGTKALIEGACAEALREGIAEGEAIQARALRELRARGVAIVEYTPEVLAALKRAWLDVVEEESAADPGFKRVWTSFAAFRAEYDNWRRIRSVPVKE